MTKNNHTGLFKSSNWRASLVAAAAVIPAPRGYTNVVAVTKIVVGFRDGAVGQPQGMSLASPSLFAETTCALD